MSNQDTFEKMLATDKKTYEMLATIEIFLQDPKTKSSSEYSYIQSRYNEIRSRYEARQADYRNNTLYKISNQITEWNDAAVSWFNNAVSNVKNWFGFGAAPLAVPVALVIGASLTAAALGYFIYQYYSETSVDYNEALKVIALTAQTNPKLAEQMTASLNAVKKNEQNTGFFTKAGEGLKTAFIITGVVAGTGTVYYLGKRMNWF